MKNIKIGMAALTAIVVIFCTLTACNFKQYTSDTSNNASTTKQKDDKEKSKNTTMQKGDKTKKAQIMPGLTEEVPQTKFVRQIYKMGEPIGLSDIQNHKKISDALTCTINKATMFADISKAGIDIDAMGNLSPDLAVQDEDGKPKSGVKFMLIELTVQNVQAEENRNITTMELLFKDAPTKLSNNMEGFFFEEAWGNGPAYFSNPTGKRYNDSWKDYYNYRLSPGQTKNLKVGWYVDTGRYNTSDLYLCVEDSDDGIKIVELDI